MKSAFLIALVAIVLCGTPACSSEAPVADETGLQQAVSQLRHVAGKWNVTTEYLNPDGTVARAVPGTYVFDWVVPDRVLSGRSSMPELELTSGILFYVREKEREIEMVSVGSDGRLWIMKGPFGSETRVTQPFAQADGGTGQLRFTGFNVTADRFESRMEYSSDGGETWVPGNHQVFRRAAGAQ